jgi:hypothetical protein
MDETVLLRKLRCIRHPQFDLTGSDAGDLDIQGFHRGLPREACAGPRLEIGVLGLESRH